MSDSGSYQSSHSSANRDSGSRHDHRQRRASGDERLMSSECNGAGDVDDGEADDMLGHLHDAEAAAEDAVSTEYEISQRLLDVLFTIREYWLDSCEKAGFSH